MCKFIVNLAIVIVLFATSAVSLADEQSRQHTCFLKANVYRMAAIGRDNGYSPKLALGLAVNAKDEQEWKTKTEELAKDGVSIAWMKEAVNQVYFDPHFVNARGQQFFTQMLELCVSPKKQFEPLK